MQKNPAQKSLIRVPSKNQLISKKTPTQKQRRKVIKEAYKYWDFMRGEQPRVSPTKQEIMNLEAGFRKMLDDASIEVQMRRITKQHGYGSNEYNAAVKKFGPRYKKALRYRMGSATKKFPSIEPFKQASIEMIKDSNMPAGRKRSLVRQLKSLQRLWHGEPGGRGTPLLSPASFAFRKGFRYYIVISNPILQERIKKRERRWVASEYYEYPYPNNAIVKIESRSIFNPYFSNPLKLDYQRIAYFHPFRYELRDKEEKLTAIDPVMAYFIKKLAGLDYGVRRSDFTVSDSSRHDK